MSKDKILLITAMTEAIIFAFTFLFVYFAARYELLQAIIFGGFLSLVSGISMYFYLVRAFGLDYRFWKKEEQKR